MKRTCMELGACQSRKPACQSRKPACQGCSWQLAPDVIDGPHRRRRRLLSASQVDVIGRAVLFVAALAALAATLGFAAGYFNVGGLLP